MPQLIRSLQAWPDEDFARILKAELKALPPDTLPLLHGLSEGGLIDDSDLELSVLTQADAGQAIEVRLACFFTEVVGGCNCHDDPYRKNACCELLLRIDRVDGEASFSPLLGDT
jgi:hypothetical protein